MSESHSITQARLHELFDYRDGKLFWKQTKGRMLKGASAGNLNKKIGYICIGIDKKTYLLHRMIFLWNHGYLPKELDHVDNNKLNNNIQNLREATHSQNISNQGLRKVNTSGYKGVFFVKKNSSWKASICVDKKRHHIGLFKTKEEAAKAYNEAAIKKFGIFAKINVL